jgi:hypothetical protein
MRENHAVSIASATPVQPCALKNLTTDFTDFTNKKDRFPIRDIREIRGHISPFAASRAVFLRGK